MMIEITDKMVEAAARAICVARGIDPDEPTHASGSTRGDYNVYERRVDRQRASAKAALNAAIAAAEKQEPVAWTDAFELAVMTHPDGEGSALMFKKEVIDRIADDVIIPLYTSPLTHPGAA